MYTSFIKRTGDIFASFILLFIFSPLLISLTLLLSFANQRRPFFLQKRPGKDGEIFTIIKFKTMNDKKDEEGNLLPDAERITKIGKFVRSYSLDELMQLVNVLLGDMSMVGPRPLKVIYLPRYNQNQARRHEVKPGITGWAQVNGRNSISWDERFALDVWYVDHINFFIDVKILLLTVVKVFNRAGISANEEVTMPDFMGNN